MTRKNLINYCNENKIKGVSNKTKCVIIDFINNHIILQNKIINKDKNIINIDTLKEENKIEIIDSKYHTKKWRTNCKWYVNGKSNECEIYQKKIIKQLIGYDLSKTNDRFNIETNEILNIKHPMKKINGFEITENFDGYVNNKNITIYVNLKFCCDIGGAQTRTLREVYHFIKCQIEYIKIEFFKKKKDTTYIFRKIYFINILDGDTNYVNMDKFKYLLSQIKDEKLNKLIHKYLFIGNMLEFSKNKILIKLLKNK